ncbi:MAG TPA: hypothetical protein VHL53_06945 [Acidimicrobiia bacterium]|nr:hypothetical protein [Acidimicrobiia bacterium]
MVPRTVQDAGYTAVGIGVLVLQQVQKGQRGLAQRLNHELGVAGRQARTALAGARTKAAPVTRRLESLPRLPGPVGRVLDGGRARLCAVLRPAA